MKNVYTGEKDPRLCKNVLGQTIPALAAEDPDVIYLDADLHRHGKMGKGMPGAGYPVRHRGGQYDRCGLWPGICGL